MVIEDSSFSTENVDLERVRKRLDFNNYFIENSENVQTNNVNFLIY